MTVPILERMPLLRGRVHEVTVLSLRGELDVVDAPALQARLAGIRWQGRPRSVLDLTGLQFIDCACLAVLARHARDIRARGGTVELAGPQGAIRRIVSVTGLLAGLKTHDTAGQAAAGRRGRRSLTFPAASLTPALAAGQPAGWAAVADGRAEGPGASAVASPSKRTPRPRSGSAVPSSAASAGGQAAEQGNSPIGRRGAAFSVRCFGR